MQMLYNQSKIRTHVSGSCMLCLLQSEQSVLSVEGQEITMLRVRKPALYVCVCLCVATCLITLLYVM
jgi:hypothetical protein